MVGALWTGISGLAGSQTGLDNESNNIANVNTIGYKSSRVSFADQMYQDKIGKGVSSFDVEKIYTVGGTKSTGVGYDMALASDGFFQLSDGVDTFYTRAGNFRKGESGNLEDVGQNTVQGWAMSPLNEDDVISTDPNATYFTNAFSNVIGSTIIRDTTSIETIVTKSTDFNNTVQSDTLSIFTGSGQKDAASKKADIDALRIEYNALLTTHANADPKPTASPSTTQKNYMNFNLNSAILAEGDTLYVNIGGAEYQVPFETDEATTLKNLADKLSNTQGYTAYYTNGVEDNPAGTIKESAYEYDNMGANPSGGIYIEGIVPGVSFNITEFGWTDQSNGNQSVKGEVKNLQTAVKGTGMGAIESVEAALKTAISGKQQDVYTSEEITFNTDATANNFSYQINIYDNESKTNKTIPATALSMPSMTSIDDMVKAINTVSNTDGSADITDLAYYVKAFNINGNLVVKTLDYNDDVEFTGVLKGPIPETQLIKMSGEIKADTGTQELQTVEVTGVDATGTEFEFLGFKKSGLTAGNLDTVEKIAALIVSNASDIISTWNAANPDKEIASITASGTPDEFVNILYKSEDGNVPDITAQTSGIITFGASTTTTQGDDTATMTFLGTDIAMTKGDNISTLVEKIIADKTAIINYWNTVGGTTAGSPTGDPAADTDDTNENREIADIIRVSSDEIKIVYKNTEGDVVSIAEVPNENGIKFGEAEELTKGSLNGEITRNLNFSGRAGAGAEFLKITTTINQASSKGSIQLQLDTLGLTDSAFGKFSIDKSGLITMQQDGVDFAVGQVAVAKFTDNRGLEAVGNNLLKATARSGTALFNIDNDKTSEIQGGILELSTADLSESLVNLMVFQRAFEANAKSITTADSILTTLIQLKR